MCLTDIGDKTIVRKGYIHQFLYVSRMTCPHLHHSNLCIGTYGKKGKRNTYIIVQIALGCSHIILDRKNFTDKFLGRSLSISTCKSDNRKRLPVNKGHGPMPSCKFLQCLQSIINRNNARVSRRGSSGILSHNGIGSTGLKGFERIFVAVKVFSLESKEHVTCRKSAGVSCHTPALLEFSIYRYNLHKCQINVL